MQSPDFEQRVRQNIEEILIQEGAHLDFASTISDLRREKLGRDIQATVDMGERHLVWLVGIVLPLSPDNSMHAVFLANNRALILQSPADFNSPAKKRYRWYMSSSRAPLSWILTPPYDIDYIEKTIVDKETSFPSFFVKGFNASEDPTSVEWLIRRAREVKSIVE